MTLTVDTGQLLVDGSITANSGALRGTISLFGGAGVELGAGGALRANGIGTGGIGGQIEIGTGELVVDPATGNASYNGGNIALDAGSTISATGTAGMGSLLLRAPALAATNDIAISALASDTSGVGGIIIEPVLPFNLANATAFADAVNPAAPNVTAPTAADFQQIQAAVGNYMTPAAANITSRLANGTPLMVEAGVELIAPGDLILQSADGQSPVLDLSPSTNGGSNWRFNGAPVDLTIRAGGNITVANSITDGFDSATVGGLQQPILLPGPSSSIRLVAGADLASANPLAVMAGGSGS